MTANEYVDKLRNDFINAQIIDSELDNLIVVNNVEKRDVKGYHGREILELLQNADDAYQKQINSGEKPSCKLEIVISYFDNNLTISNTGTFFDKDGVKAIVQGNNSPKKGGFIGSKGTGFRSVLNWATSVRIDSGDFHIQFSEKNAKEIFEQIREKPQIKKQLEKEPNLYVPILAVPKNVDPVGKNDRTTIQIEVNPGKIENDGFGVVEQIEEIDLRILLFLPNVSEIKIEMEGKSIIYRREDSSYDDEFEDEVEIRKLQKIQNGKIEKEEAFWVFPKVLEKYIEEDNQKKDVLLSVAVPQDYSSFTNGFLYSFFPLLDKESPFNCVLHATYILGQDRNTLFKNENNKTILKAQIDFIIEVAERFSKIGRYDVVWNILLPPNFSKSAWRFLSIENFGIEGDYLDSLLNKKIFENVNGNSISIQDGLKIISGYIPSVFHGELFNKLLKAIDDDDGRKILFLRMLFKYCQLKNENNGKSSYEIYQLCQQNRFCWNSTEIDTALTYNDQELCGIINQLTESWTVDNRVDVFIWWNCFYKPKKIKAMLPNLLKKQNNEWLKYNEECYFLTGDFEDIVIPEWVKTPALCNNKDERYQDILFKRTETLPIYKEKKDNDLDKHVSRIICDEKIFKSINFRYRDRSTIISPINSSVRSYEQSVEFVKWLWKNYRNDADWNPPDKSLLYNFPTKAKNVEKSKNLAFGKSYGNELAEILFEGSYAFFPEIGEFGVGETDRDQFRRFIQKFGVKYSPKITKQQVRTPKDYIDEIKKNIGGEIEKVNKYSFSIELPYIQNLELILKKLKSDTFKWILLDKNVRKRLTNFYYTKKDDIVIKYDNGTLNPSSLKEKSDKIPNYILFIFKSTTWLPIDGYLCAPQNCTHNQIKSQLWYREIKSLYSEHESDEDDSLSLDKILQNLGVKSDNLDLSPESFYKELLKLDDHDEMAQLYRKIANPKNNDRVQKFRVFNGTEKKSFLENGMVLLKTGILCKATDAFFTSSAILNFANKPIMNTPSRQGKYDIFHDIFGVQKYQETINVDLDSIKKSDFNVEFEKDFKSFLPDYLARLEDLRSGITDEVVKHFKDLVNNVHLVSELKIKVDGGEKTLTVPYTVIQDNLIKKWYIYTSHMGYDKVVIADVLKQIFYVELDNPAEEQLKECSELFVFNSEYRKKKLINDYSISEEVVSRFEKMLYNTENYVDKIKELYPEKWNACIEQLIQNIDFTYKKQGKTLVDLLRQLGVEISDFNAKLDLDLSLVDYNKKLLNSSLDKLEENVYCSIADSLCEKTLEEKKKIGEIFEEIKLDVKNYSRDIVETATFDADGEIENIVKEKVGLWSNDAGRYGFNNTRLLQKVGVDNDNESQYISNLLYFKIDWDSENIDTDEVVCELIKGLLEQREFVDGGVDDNPGGVDGGDNGPDGGPGVGDIPPSHWKPSRGGGSGGGDASGKGKGKKEIGDKGETFIYNKISEKKISEIIDHVGDYDIEDVKWVSGAGGRKKNGRPQDGKGYDIAVYGKDDRKDCKLFIEVKTSTQRACSFNMSSNERNKAKMEKNDYAVIFVYYDKEQKKCEYWYLGNPCDEDNKAHFEFTETEFHVDYREDPEKNDDEGL